jgi:ketosteroid isomerase-like protein
VRALLLCQAEQMQRTEAMAWVAAYERAWRDGDLDGMRALFTEDAEYWHDPYQPPAVGHAAIAEFWADDVDATFTVSAEPVAVEGPYAVIRLEVEYLTPVRQPYRNLWVLHFAGDGRVEKFEEWAFFPGKPITPSEHAEPAG